MNALTQVLGSNGRILSNILNNGIGISPQAGVNYVHIAGAGTLLVETSACSLLSLNINTGAAASTATVYDSAGTASLPGSLEVAVLTIGTVAPMAVRLGPEDRGFTLNNGLVIVTTGSADITFGVIA